MPKIDRKLYMIFEDIEQLAIRGDFEEIDRLMSIEGCFAHNLEIDSDILIGWLTVTLPCKTKLKNRGTFFDTVKRELTLRGEMEPDLLKGLEQ